MNTTTRYLVGVLALCVASGTGCVAPDDEAPLGEAAEAQVDPLSLDYALYQIQQDGTSAGHLLVTRTAGLGYDANREYWYLNRNLSSTSTLTFSGGTAHTWAAPPNLIHLSFVTARTPEWVSGTPKGALLQETYVKDGVTLHTGIDWRITITAGVGWGGYIKWWHSNHDSILGPKQTDTFVYEPHVESTWYSYTTAPLPGY
jgi:hypothetical protein